MKIEQLKLHLLNKIWLFLYGRQDAKIRQEIMYLRSRIREHSELDD